MTKLTNDNINLLKDKYNYELNKEIEKILNNKEKLLEINHITFIGELLQIKYKLDSTIPDFFLKQQISFDKIIEAIKKYIEEKFIKTKNSTEQNIKNLTSQNILLEEKYKNIFDEYNRDKNDFKQTVDKYNDMLIENKLKQKTLEEKIKNFENEKKILKETMDRNILEIDKKYEDKINNLNMEINKLKTEIKAKEEEILLEKLNKDQLSALDMQKITFLENESKKWKERYNEQSKDLSEAKTEKIHLAADIDKLKSENKNLKNKLNGITTGDMNNFDKKMNVTFGNSTSGFYAGANRAGNKLLMELLNEQNSIKDFLKEIKDNTNTIINMNKDIMNNVQNINKDKNKEKIEVKEIKENKEDKENMEIKDNKETNENKNIILNLDNDNNIKGDENKINNKQSIDNINNNIESIKTNEILNSESILNNINNPNLNYNHNKENIINNISDTNLESLKIKIVNNVLKKSMSGKPYFDYICEIKNNDKTNKLHRKLMNFYVLHKSLIEYFKDKINIPDKDNLFIDENIKNASLENKQDLLNNYIEEILKINEIKQSQIFQNFFEINT